MDRLVLVSACPSAEHLVQLATGIALGEFCEGALLGDLLRRAHEACPGRTCQRTADADPAHTEVSGLLNRQTRGSDQEVDGLWRNRFHYRRDLLFGLDARRIEAIGARVR